MKSVCRIEGMERDAVSGLAAFGHCDRSISSKQTPCHVAAAMEIPIRNQGATGFELDSETA